MDGAAGLLPHGRGPSHAFGHAYFHRLVELIASHLEVEPHHGVLCEPYDPAVAQALADLGCLGSPPRPWGPGETAGGHAGTRDTERALVVMLDTKEEEEGSLKGAAWPVGRVLGALPPGGRLLVVRRPPETCSLPLFSAAHRRLRALQPPCTKIINDLKDAGADVEWDVERIPVTISKSGWLALLRDRRLGLLSTMSDREIHDGIQELSDGCLKYSGDTLAFEDLVMFIAATRRSRADGTEQPLVQRRGSGLQPAPWEPPYRLALTQQLRALLPARPRPDLAEKCPNLF